MNTIATRSIIRKYIILTIILVGIVIAAFFGNLAFVRQNPGGLDFLAHWQGIKLFISNGQNPYSDATANLINSTIRSTLAGNEGTYRFVNPLFSIIFYAPFSLINNFETARAAWMTFLEILAVAAIVLSIRSTSLRQNIWLVLIIGISGFLSVPMLRSLMNSSMAIVGFAFLCFSASTLIQNQDEAAGLLLAFSLVIPNLSGVCALFIVIWAILNKRWKLVGWFIGTFVLLIGFSVLLIPGWLVDYGNSLVKYSGINPVRAQAFSPSLLTIRLMITKNLILLGLLISEFFFVRTVGKRRLLWQIALLFTVSPWLGWKVQFDHTILVIPGLIIGLGFLLDVWQNKAKRALFLMPLLLWLLLWLFSGYLFEIPISLTETFTEIIFPSIVLVLIYWSRWWILSKEKYPEFVEKVR